jgi:hypothetical protein
MKASKEKNMKPIFAVLLLGSVLALAAGVTYRLSINGQAFSSPAITVSGEIYIPLKALERAGVKVTRSGSNLALALPGAPVTAGGANQRASLEGCMGETLFNGIWRVRVSKLERITRDPGTPGAIPGWGLTVELRNGSKGTLMPTDTGVDGTGQGIQLAFADAQTLSVDPLDVQKLTFASLPQGGVVIHQLKFYYPLGTDPSTVQKPVKFLFEINPRGFEAAIRSRAGGASYTTSTPSLRVRLDCQN